MATPEDLYRVQSQLEGGLGTLNAKVNAVSGTATAVLNTPVVSVLLTPAVCNWIINAVNVFCQAVVDILAKIWEFLQGIAAPITFLIDTFTWLDVQKEAARISEAVDPAINTSMKVDNEWKGQAAAAYRENTRNQPVKAKVVSAAAGKVSVSLAILGGAGLAFYIALGVIITKLVIAAITAITALGTVVFSWVGLGIIVEEAAVTPAMIITAFSALTACVAVQVQQAASIQGEIDSAFPSGTWPDPATGDFSDASMGQDTAGPKDDSDWRLRP